MDTRFTPTHTLDRTAICGFGTAQARFAKTFRTGTTTRTSIIALTTNAATATRTAS